MSEQSFTIGINGASCIACGKCVWVCPTGTLLQESKGAAVEVTSVRTCIECGHCVDVCPTDSVVHSLFPPEKVHLVDNALLPTPEQVMALIKSRRSNRALSSEAVPAEAMERIVEAARYAPTASNGRKVGFTIVSDAALLREVSDFVIRTFEAMVRPLNNPLVRWVVKRRSPGMLRYAALFERLNREHAGGGDPILRTATALLVIHTPKASGYGCADANLAYQNASLMAQALGISQIYMGFVMLAIKRDKRGELARIMGVDDEVHAIMALGMPAVKYLKYTER